MNALGRCQLEVKKKMWVSLSVSEQWYIKRNYARVKIAFLTPSGLVGEATSEGLGVTWQHLGWPPTIGEALFRWCDAAGARQTTGPLGAQAVHGLYIAVKLDDWVIGKCGGLMWELKEYELPDNPPQRNLSHIKIYSMPGREWPWLQ